MTKNTVRFAHAPCDFISLYSIVFTFKMRLKSSNYKSHWNMLVLFEYVPQKNVWFCFNSIVLVHFSHKTEKSQFWKSLKYFNIFLIKKDMVSHLSMPHRKMSDCFISIIWVHFTHKTGKFQFWKLLKYFNIFLIKKNMVSDLNYVPWKNVWFCFISIV